MYHCYNWPLMLSYISIIHENVEEINIDGMSRVARARLSLCSPLGFVPTSSQPARHRRVFFCLCTVPCASTAPDPKQKATYGCRLLDVGGRDGIRTHVPVLQTTAFRVRLVATTSILFQTTIVTCGTMCLLRPWPSVLRSSICIVSQNGAECNRLSIICAGK